MIWLLSVTIIDLVRLPCVASTSFLSFFASSLILLMGAEPGVTIATTFDDATTFPNPMLTRTGLVSPFFMSDSPSSLFWGLLYVLDLLLHFFYGGLHLHSDA